MPILPASKSLEVEVTQPVEVTMTVDKTVAAAEIEDVAFSGVVSGASLPTSIYIQTWDGTTWVDQWGPISTDEYGSFSYTTRMPPEWGCQTKEFRAIHKPSGVASTPIYVTIGYGTRLVIAKFEPRPVPAGTWAEYQLVLEHYYYGSWAPLAGKTIEVFYDNTRYATHTTDTWGAAYGSIMFETPGTYLFTASYYGEGLPAGLLPTRAELVIGAGVLSPESMLSALGALIPLLTLAGVMAFTESRR